MELSNSVSIQKQTENEEQITSKNNNETEKILPIYMDLYPPVAEDLDYETNAKILKLTPNDKQKNKKLITGELLEKEEDTYEMDNDFLDSLLQRKTFLDKKKIINTIPKFIRNSKLIQKLQSEFRSDKKSDLENLIKACAKNLGYVKLQKGEITSTAYGEYDEQFQAFGILVLILLIIEVIVLESKNPLTKRVTLFRKK